VFASCQRMCRCGIAHVADFIFHTVKNVNKLTKADAGLWRTRVGRGSDERTGWRADGLECGRASGQAEERTGGRTDGRAGGQADGADERAHWQTSGLGGGRADGRAEKRAGRTTARAHAAHVAWRGGSGADWAGLGPNCAQEVSCILIFSFY
jgi:hypothetical protein